MQEITFSFGMETFFVLSSKSDKNSKNVNIRIKHLLSTVVKTAIGEYNKITKLFLDAQNAS